MAKEKFINEGGIQGAATGHVDTQSEDWQAFQGVIKEHSLGRTREERISTRLAGIKFRMEDYLRGESLRDTASSVQFLRECVEALEIKNKDFASYIGIEESNLSAMLNGRRKISPGFALKLEQIFNISSTMWLSIQIKNELQSIRNTRDTGQQKLNLKELLAKAG